LTRSFFEWAFLVTPLFVTFLVDFYMFLKRELSVTFVSDPREMNIACKEYVGIMGCCMMGCLLLIIAILTFSTEAVFVFCFAVYALYPLPQIIFNFSSQKQFKINLWVWGLIGPLKLFYLGYLKAYPFNLFRISPNLGVIYFTGGFIFLEWVLLLIQVGFPTFGLKRRKRKTNLHEEICAICLEEFDTNQNDQLLRDIVKTPCGHFYHVKCLRSSFRNNDKCPMCRHDLPEFWECPSSSLYEP